MIERRPWRRSGQGHQRLSADRPLRKQRATKHRSYWIGLLCFLSVMVSTACSSGPARAEDRFPALFSYLLRRSPGDEKVLPAPVRAAGFSHDGKTLAVWFSNRLALLDGDTGMERGRVSITMSSSAIALPQIAFDPTGQYCCIARRWAQYDQHRYGFEIVLVDVRRLVASDPFASESALEWESDNYEHESTNFPLRQILCIEKVEDGPRATCEVTFPTSADQPAGKVRLYVSLFSNRECPHLDAADRAYQAVAEANNLKIESNERGGLIFGGGRVQGIPAMVEAVKKQVALSNDGKTLLTQRVREANGSPPFQYFFAFYDVSSRKRIAEIHWPTEFYWRSYGHRGFAFARDLGKVAVFGRRGSLHVYDLSAIVARLVENADAVPLWDYFGLGP